MADELIRCCFCNAGCPDLRSLRAHSAACPKHPLRAEVERLRAERDRLRTVAEGLAEALERCAALLDGESHAYAGEREAVRLANVALADYRTLPPACLTPDAAACEHTRRLFRGA